MTQRRRSRRLSRNSVVTSLRDALARGGRRLLSSDVAMLDRAAMIVARRLDALRLTEERFERTLLEREMRTLATEAELRVLWA